MQTILFRHVITIDSSLVKEHVCYKYLFEPTKKGDSYKRYDYVYNHKSNHYDRYIFMPKLLNVCNANISRYLLSFEYWSENDSKDLSADLESQILTIISDEQKRLEKLLNSISVSKKYFKKIK